MPAPFAAALPKLARLVFSDCGSSTLNRAMAPTGFSPNCMVEQYDSTADKMLGTRTHSKSGIVDNLARVTPSMSFRPSVGEWANLIEWFMCGEVSSGTFSLGDREKVREIGFDDTQRYWRLTDVAANTATISASAGGALQCDIEGIGVSYTAGTGSFPSNLTFPSGPPFMMTQLSITMGAIVGVNCRNFNLTINNVMDANRYFFGATIAGPVATDRLINVQLEIPYGMHNTLWAAGAGADGVSITATFTRGLASLSFSMPFVKAPAPSPQVRVPDEIFISWSGQAVHDTTNQELTVIYNPGS